MTDYSNMNEEALVMGGGSHIPETLEDREIRLKKLREFLPAVDGRDISISARAMLDLSQRTHERSHFIGDL